MLCWVLISSVIGGQARADRAGVRTLIVGLAIIGTLVGVIFSIVGWGSDENGVTGV